MQVSDNKSIFLLPLASSKSNLFLIVINDITEANDFKRNYSNFLRSKRETSCV